MIIPEELRESLFLQLLMTYKALRRKSGKDLKKVGLCLGQDIILFHLSSQPGISQTQLAKALGVEEATISIMLQRMARTGLIKRTADEKDARMMRVSLTAKGLELRKKALRIWQKQENQIFSSFTEEQKRELLKSLLEIQSYIDSRKGKKEN
ncbi:MAG: winged helix DNA-binding protein [Sulfolobaceae archaeon]